MNELWRPRTETSRVADIIRAVALVASASASRGEASDHDGGFPFDDVVGLHNAGLLLAPFPSAMGGVDLGCNPLALRDVLTIIGRGSLALGRLYEGHINAVKLVRLYGSSRNLELLHSEASSGRLSSVWMAEDDKSLFLDDATSTLTGRKILASGAGFIWRPLVAARYGSSSLMVLPLIEDCTRAATSSWTALGMRASATGTVDFTGITIGPDEIVGEPGDYMRSPHFRGGAWRVLAVQLGGVQRLVMLFREQLAASPHAEAPLQLARLAEATAMAESARLWVTQACLTAEGASDDADRIDAYVDLARNAFEQFAVGVIAASQKAVGLRAFLRPNPMERIIRDLSTYLRQPALDLSLLSAGKYCLQEEGAGLLFDRIGEA